MPILALLIGFIALWAFLPAEALRIFASRVHRSPTRFRSVLYLGRHTEGVEDRADISEFLDDITLTEPPRGHASQSRSRPGDSDNDIFGFYDTYSDSPSAEHSEHVSNDFDISTPNVPFPDFCALAQGDAFRNRNPSDLLDAVRTTLTKSPIFFTLRDGNQWRVYKDVIFRSVSSSIPVCTAVGYMCNSRTEVFVQPNIPYKMTGPVEARLAPFTDILRILKTNNHGEGLRVCRGQARRAWTYVERKRPRVNQVFVFSVKAITADLLAAAKSVGVKIMSVDKDRIRYVFTPLRGSSKRPPKRESKLEREQRRNVEEALELSLQSGESSANPETKNHITRQSEDSSVAPKAEKVVL